MASSQSADLSSAGGDRRGGDGDAKSNETDEDLDAISEKVLGIFPSATCSICHDVMQVPASMKCPRKEQRCRALACLRCFRNYMKLEESPRVRKPSACIVCRSQVPSTGLSINIHSEMFGIFDNIITDKALLRCRSCDFQCTDQSSLLNHFRVTCPDSIVKCKNCKLWAKRSFVEGEHQKMHEKVECPVCNIPIAKPRYKAHIEHHAKTCDDKIRAHQNVLADLVRCREKLASIMCSEAWDV